MQLAEQYLDTIIKTFKSQKQLAEKAMKQLEPAQFHSCIDEEANSVAHIVKHVSGNMRSRWRDFLSSDGEKSDRNRDDEFVDDLETVEDIMLCWEDGWKVVLETLESLEPSDLSKTITIRSEAHSVIEAIERQVSHYAYHVGQMVFLAKHLRSENWQTLSIARGESASFNQKTRNKI